MEIFGRTKLIFGEEGMEKLKNSRVAVFGLGGVGGYVVEALVRSGIGGLALIDGDSVSLSNLNRQIIATRDTLGMSKTRAAAERVKSINPECEVEEFNLFYLADTADKINFRNYSYIVDAVDTVAAKVLIIKTAKECGVPVISCMGAGNKVDITALRVADISQTKVCPLARAVRRELRKAGIEEGVKTVYSEEQPVPAVLGGEVKESGRPVAGSCALVPPAAGLIMAGEVVKDITKIVCYSAQTNFS